MRFSKAYVEITNVCNLSCAFCPGTGRKPAFMDRAAFELVLERLRGRTGLLYFHLMGEPLLHPLLPDFLALSGEKGFRVNLTTNGSLLGAASDALLSAPALRQLNLSLHSHGGGPGLEEYLDGVASFLERADAAGRPLVSLRLWNYSPGSGDGDPALRRAIEERFRVRLPERADGRAFRGLRLGRRAYLNLAEAFEWPSLTAPPIGDRGFCRGLRDQIGVLADGSVVPCCLDAQGAAVLGNILESDLDSILAGDKAARIYRGFSERRAVEELCRRCAYRLRFDGREPPAA